MTIQTNFIPKRREISAVTNALNAQVTTTEDHGYELDQYVRLIVPPAYEMSLDYVQAKIINIDSTTSFTTDVDTRSQLAYTTPTFPPAFTTSQVVPISGLEDNDISITG